jgi:NAD(P)-dependent dehydrogenase (short-subunit alcohol dehydrogenase family)
VTDLDEAAAQGVADEIAATGGEAAAHPLDVADEGQWAQAVATAARLFGPVAMLVGNAALTSPAMMARDLGVLDLDMADWDRVIRVNLRGNLLGCRAVLPAMLEAGKGSITFTSSILGARAGRARAAYSVSKGGLDALVRAVATTYGSRGIRCNAVAPGFVVTDAMRGAASPERIGALARTSALGRLAAPEEIAAVIAFVASDRASYLTGQILTVDGGVISQLGI